MCDDADRNYIRKVSLGGEPIEVKHIRLIVVARVFDNIAIFNLLDNSYKGSRKLILKYIEKISSNENILYDWLENFINNIEPSDLRKYARIRWGKKVAKIESKSNPIKDLFYGKL